MHGLLSLYKAFGEYPNETGYSPSSGESFLCQKDIIRFLGLNTSSYKDLKEGLEVALEKAANRFGDRFFMESFGFESEAEYFLRSRFPAESKHDALGLRFPRRQKY